MKITIVAVGKIKEKFYREAVAEFQKRLNRYVKLEIIEVADEKTPEEASEREKEIILEQEGARILKHIRSDTYVIALAIEGKMSDSIAFSEKIRLLGVNGTGHLVFIIGGSLGLADDVLKRADLKLSFSRMTFPHQLMRVILLEQIYRSYRIINHEPYHK
ncbi:Ribosomal RNA large subunit methyltransferase H [Eubacterium plexicaudatum ASF492]|uniref:Ribosomal RNA large subunit methyltransferase H n=1 Tax=Eubacterium plexicaudatum ASF492 TaxID=1235802 RepID=N2B6L9_9FIRM|nr:Ribosomal RNA large subunit methyltransferase H [Eubacterium plexicaudatum ASF492]